MKKFIIKVVSVKMVFIAVLVVLTLVQFPINPKGNNLKLDNQVNNLPKLSSQLSAQETSVIKNLFLLPQKTDSLSYQEENFAIEIQSNLETNNKKNQIFFQHNNPTQKNNFAVSGRENKPILYAQENISQEDDPLLALASEEKKKPKWNLVGEIIVDWDIQSTDFSPNEESQVVSETTSNDTFYIDISYENKEVVGFNLELYPSQNLKLESFLTFKIKNIVLNAGVNYDTRQDSHQTMGYFQFSSRDGFYGGVLKDRGLESPHQGGEHLFIETENQKNSTKNREYSISQSAEFSVLHNDYFSGLEVGFARENLKLTVTAELNTGITSAFGGQQYDGSISLIDFYNAATDNNSIFTNPTYFGATTANESYSKINAILAFSNSSNVLDAAEDYPSITSLIAGSQSFITDAGRVGATASSLTPTSTNDAYQTETLRFYRSETIYSLFNNLALEILGLNLNQYQERKYDTTDLLATEVVTALDNFLAARVLLEESVADIVPDFEPFSANTVSGNVAFKFDHQWKNLTYGLLLTQGSYSGRNWVGNTSIAGGGVKFAIGKKFHFFMNSFTSSLITNYKDKHFTNSSTVNIEFETEDLTSNIDFGIDYTWGQSAFSLAVGNGEIIKKYNTETGTSIQYNKKNTHNIAEIGYKIKLGNINLKAGIASVVEQGESSVNYSLSSLNGNHNLVNGDKLNTTIYKVRFEQQF